MIGRLVEAPPDDGVPVGVPGMFDPLRSRAEKTALDGTY